MRKSISDRIRVTKRGKALHRVQSQSHFLAKKRSIEIGRKKKMRRLYLGKYGAS